jgi:hypothetical protein
MDTLVSPPKYPTQDYMKKQCRNTLAYYGQGVKGFTATATKNREGRVKKLSTLLEILGNGFFHF